MRHSVTFFVAAAALAATANAQARELTLAERIEAQAAIDRVYYAHQIGVGQRFEEAVPRSALEKKVVNYLRQSVYLEQYWHTRISAEALQREMERIITHTRAPDRLREVFAALGDDPLLIQECLARPALVERFTRSFISGATLVPGPNQEMPGAGDAPTPRSWNESWDRIAPAIDSREATVVAEDVPARTLDPGHRSGRDDGLFERFLQVAAGSAACPDDTWNNGILDDTPDPGLRSGIWTGSQLFVWGGYRPDGPPAGWLYDPILDTWSPIATEGAPGFRTAPSVSWAGGAVVVWGGQDQLSPPFAYLNTGARYNPLTDTWLPVTTTGAPEPRSHHLGVSAGTLMIVWGGYSTAGGYLSSGGRYDPSTDTWTSMNPLDAPSGTSRASSVWTGQEVIVWGGLGDAGYTNAGGRYDPVHDTWHPTSILGAPIGRSLPSAVWTGTRMIIWGGHQGIPLSDGALYDPAMNTWEPMGIQNAPAGREGHSAIWTGTQMVVWGGASSTELGDGARYDPANHKWTALSNLNAPSPRRDAITAWTGQLMIVWAGTKNSSRLNTGGRYDPSSDTWTPTSTGGSPEMRFRHTAVWTGSQMIVWGGQGAFGQMNTGGLYDPMLDAWRPTSTSMAPEGRSEHRAVWTGDRMIVWGGRTCSATCVSLNSGGRYQPLTDTWSPTSVVDAPAARLFHTAVWSGSSMIVFGGISEDSTAGTAFNTGGRYNPQSDSWTATSTSGAPTVFLHAAIWTGQQMVVTGGAAGRYDPVGDSWLPGPVNSRVYQSAVWTGQEMLVWGGQSGSTFLQNGFAYNPVTNITRFITTIGAPSPRADHSAVWNGSAMIVWGGRGAGNASLGGGGRYDPATLSWAPISSLHAPSPRTTHSAVWTGDAMIVWGGFTLGGVIWNTGYRYQSSPDMDHDTFTVCSGDCNDGSAAIHPGAGDVCNGLDDNCDGTVDEGVDADGDGRRTCGGDCDDTDATVWGVPGPVSGLILTTPSPTDLDWDGQAAAVGPSVMYQVASGSISAPGIDFSTAACLATVATPQFEDARSDPARGTAYWYLIRGKTSCGSGTYGSAQSDAQIPPCP